MNETTTTVWWQKQFALRPEARGCHLITDQVLSALEGLEDVRIGWLHLFIQHTSASLALNENADADVLRDMEMALNRICPEDLPFVHTVEGPDDMAAHVKATLTGCSLTIPISNGKLALGTWQGIYLCEHRNRGGPRKLVATIFGTR